MLILISLDFIDTSYRITYGYFSGQGVQPPVGDFNVQVSTLDFIVQIKLVNRKQGIYIFQLDENNYIKFCPERGGVITNWVSENNEIIYLDEKRFLDRGKD